MTHFHFSQILYFNPFQPLEIQIDNLQVNVSNVAFKYNITQKKEDNLMKENTTSALSETGA